MSIILVRANTVKSLVLKICKLSLSVSIALGTVFAVSVSATQSAQASSCSCNQSTLYTIDIEELNANHPHQLTLKSNDAYYQLVDAKDQVIQDKLYDISAYEDGRIIAKRNGHFGAIDTTGKVALDFKYDAIDVLNNGFYHLTQYFGSKEATAIATGTGSWLYPDNNTFDKNTQVDYLYADDVNQITYFTVLKNGKHGLITDKNQTLITPIYDELALLDTCPNERLFMKAVSGDKVGLIDQYQKVVVPFAKNIDIENFNEDKQLFSVKSSVPQGDGNIGHLNRETVISEKLVNGKGILVIESDASIRLLNDNLYEYKVSNKYGVIDNNGVTVLPVNFDHLYSQYSQYNAPILAAQHQKIGIITKNHQGELGVNTFYDGLEQSAYSTYSLSEIENQKVKEDEYNDNDEDIDNTVKDTDQTNNLLEVTAYNPINQHYIAQLNNKFGIVDSHNKVLIPIIYDELSFFERFIKVKKDSKYGLLTDNNETVKALIYDDITPLSDSHGTDDNIGIVFTKDNQQQLTNEFGSIITPFSDYRFVDNKLDYLEDMSVIEKDGKYGLFSVKDRKVIIQPIYEDMYERIYNNSILAQLNGKKVLIDTLGKMLIDDLSQYDEINRSNNEENIIVKTTDGNKYGVIDYKGKTIIPADYDSLELQSLSNNYSDVWNESDSKTAVTLYIAEKNGKYGAFNRGGDIVAPLEYTYIQSISYPAYLLVTKNKITDGNINTTGIVNFGLMSPAGKLVLEMKYDAIVSNYYDPEGKIYAINTERDTVEIYDNTLKRLETQNLTTFAANNEWYDQ